jgi:peptidoglycan L-alanyl-D-glutamate endopeptidase CwlK|tara:strand:+ start:387 stop:869 length:483 start_codon:yes stop_codon:yes gene_type:complete
MSFKLSQRSMDRLEGVHPDMVKCVTSAIEWSKVDFGVICGTRTKSQQAELVKSGASQTMNSKHLPQEVDGFSHAVDLMAYVNDGSGSRASWELNLYDDIADAMAKAAKTHNVAIKWGAAWSIGNIAQWNSTMEGAMNSYIDLRRSEGRRPFIDGPHFELI